MERAGAGDSFFLLSLWFEGPDQISHSLMNMSLPSALTIVYLAFAATLTGYTLWGRLLASLPTHMVAPLTLMVPVIGLTAAWVLLGEALSALQITGALIVMGGLLINVFGPRLLSHLRDIFRSLICLTYKPKQNRNQKNTLNKNAPQQAKTCGKAHQ
jgi:O-acetylserine/cysteine efflux transporter